MNNPFRVPGSEFRIPSSGFRDAGCGIRPAALNPDLVSRISHLETRNLKRGSLVNMLLAAMLLFPLAVSAQKITIDPTRPPAGFGIGAADPERDTGGGIRLQSVMISPTQSAAIINGVTVRLGEKYGDAVLVRVAESEVVLRRGGAQQVLKIHPGVEKREIKPAALAAPAAKSGQGARP